MKKKVIINTILLILSLSFYIVPQTNAKYITDRTQENVISYDTSFYKLYDGSYNLTLREPPISTSSTISFYTLFSSSTLLKDSNREVDNYTFTLTDGCTLSNASGAVNKLSYSQANQTTTLYITCDVETLRNNNNSNLEVNLEVKEQFSVDGINEEPFNYADFSYSTLFTTYDAFFEVMHQENEKTFNIEDCNYNNFVEWIKDTTYYNESSYSNIILQYIDDNLNSSNFISNIGNVKGISSNIDSETCTFEIENNFEGYARTYRNQILSRKRIFFSDLAEITEVEINDALNYYLNTYVYDDENVASNVYIYIINNGGIISLINGETTINGVEYVSSGDYVIIEDEVITYMNASPTSKTIYINFDNISNMYNSYMVNINAKNYLSDNAKETLIDDEGELINVILDVIKNNNYNYPNEKVAFDNYYSYKDTENNKYVFIEVSSTGTDYNVVNIELFDITDLDLDIAFANGIGTGEEDLLNITITSTNTQTISLASIFLADYLSETSVQVTMNTNQTSLDYYAYKDDINQVYNFVKVAEEIEITPYDISSTYDSGASDLIIDFTNTTDNDEELLNVSVSSSSETLVDNAIIYIDNYLSSGYEKTDEMTTTVDETITKSYMVRIE